MPFRNKIAKTVAVFGVALTSCYIVPEIQAEEIELTFSPGSIPANPNYPQAVIIDELGLAFFQWNDFAGKTLYAQSLTSVNVVNEGDILSTARFSGTFTLNFTALQTSTAFVGFRSAGNVGWFSMDLGGFEQPITYLDGAYANAGENIQVGGKAVLLGDVNCDGTVDLLDVQPFVDLLVNGGFSDKADMNQDGLVDLLDVNPFVDALSQPPP